MRSGYRRWVGWALLAAAVGAVSMLPRMDFTRSRPESYPYGVFDGPAEGPRPVAPSAGPGRVGLYTLIGPDPAQAVLEDYPTYFSMGAEGFYPVYQLSQEEWGLARLTPYTLLTPSARTRGALSFVGLRPGQVGHWLAGTWPEAAALALASEGAWARRDDWDRPDVGRSYATVASLAAALEDAEDDWVRRTAETYRLVGMQTDDHEADQVARARWALDQLAIDSHPVMVELAVSHLGPRVPLPLGPDDVRLLRSVADQHPEHALDVGLFATHQALRAGDLAAAAEWLPHIEAGTAIAEHDWKHTGGSKAIRSLRSQLLGAGLLAPEGWKDELQASAWQCADAGADGTTYKGRGMFVDGAWQLGWVPSDPLTACVDRAMVGITEVPNGQALEWWIEIRRLP